MVRALAPMVNAPVTISRNTWPNSLD